jgi:hypothetical protein
MLLWLLGPEWLQKVCENQTNVNDRQKNWKTQELSSRAVRRVGRVGQRILMPRSGLFPLKIDRNHWGVFLDVLGTMKRESISIGAAGMVGAGTARSCRVAEVRGCARAFARLSACMLMISAILFRAAAMEPQMDGAQNLRKFLASSAIERANCGTSCRMPVSE